MDDKEKRAISLMEEAVQLSRIPTNLFLVDIAYAQGLSKSFYYEWASKSEACAQCFDLLTTNLERTIHQAVKSHVISERHAHFMIERDFAGGEESNVTTVKIEGVQDDVVQKIIGKISDEVD